MTRDIAGHGGAKGGVDGGSAEEDSEECGCVHIDVDSINWANWKERLFREGGFRAHVKCVANEWKGERKKE